MQKLEHQEQRVAFRVSVRRSTGINAALILGGKKLAAVVGDISAEGMFIKLERGPLAALKVDSNVDVEVIFDGEKMYMRGVIRSAHNGGYGIFFPPRDRLGRPNPLARFERISAFLQRSSLSQRLKVLKLPE
ncbi:MAG TPA: PilZ domain-containing protein [Gammaproteobacteria bacterium]|nr:PilZ domain-containing protein [Gammaproteobacteria bacterium]